MIRALLLILMLALSARAEESGPAAQMMRMRPVGATHFYHIALIEWTSAIDPEGKELAQLLLASAAGFLSHEFRARYPELPSSFFDEMLSNGIQIKSSDKMLVMFRGNDPTDVVATLRVAYPDANGAIPLERDLNWRYPRRPLERTWWPELNRMQGEILGIGSPGMRLTGDPVELKNLVSARDIPDDLVSILFWFADEQRLLAGGRSLPLSEIPPELLAKFPIHQPTQMEPFRLYTSLENALRYQAIGMQISKDAELDGWYVEGMSLGGEDPLRIPTMTISAGEYVLECDRRMIPYYRRLGFELVQETPVKDNNFVMRISRIDYLERASMVMMRRPGFKTWHNAERVAWITGRHFSCAQALSPVRRAALGKARQGRK